VIPTARPLAEAEAVFAAWVNRGYKTAAWIDPGKPHPAGVHVALSGKFPGYANAVNALCAEVLNRDPTAEWIVTGGDDIWPDMNHEPGAIAAQCRERFAGTFGIMQPCGDPDGGFAGGEIGSAVSPWMGRDWCKYAYGGKGPMWGEYWHYYVDTELREVARRLRCYWERPDLHQRHDHWKRMGDERPAHLEAAARMEHACAVLYRQRASRNFPGSEPLRSERIRQTWKPAIVQLGRAGDVLNLMPLARALNATIITTAEYALLLDGASYGDAAIHGGKLEDAAGAVAWARERWNPVYCAQQFGNARPLRQHESFAIDAWELCGGRGWMWGRLPLVFDRRNREREAELVNKFMPPADARPAVLVSLTGTSGPLPCAKDLRAMLHERLDGTCNVIDLDRIHCERMYDLLGLYDRAAALVTIDTATLHLAHACSRLPVLYLRPEGWTGSPPRGRVVWSIMYGEVQADVSAAAGVMAGIVSLAIQRTGENHAELRNQSAAA
jgi:hypothetical protein